MVASLPEYFSFEKQRHCDQKASGLANSEDTHTLQVCQCRPLGLLPLKEPFIVAAEERLLESPGSPTLRWRAALWDGWPEKTRTSWGMPVLLGAQGDVCPRACATGLLDRH